MTMSKTKSYIEFHEAIDRLEEAIQELNKTLAEINQGLESESVEPKRDIKADKEAVRGKLSEIASKGHTKEIKDLLKKFGAEKLSDVDPKDYEDLYYSAESLEA